MRPLVSPLAGLVSLWTCVALNAAACSGGTQSGGDAGVDAPLGADTTPILLPDGSADSPAPADALAPVDALGSVDASSTGDGYAPGDGGPDAGGCGGPSSSTLDGVSLSFPSARCRFSQAEVAAGIEIPYEVVVAHDLTGVQPRATDEGHCGMPGASGLIVSFAITGVGQNYCLCDLGLCTLPAATTAPHAGRYPATIAWDGTNWRGPSDVPSPKGPLFPPDTYDVTVVARGTTESGAAFEVSAKRTLTITPDP